VQERRGYVRTLSDGETDLAAPPPTSLARIEVRRVERTRTGEIETLTDLALLGESLVAIKRASGRTRMGELLIGAMEHGFDQVFTAALLLTLRAGLLLGWRGFARGRDASAMQGLDSVAVPLHVPSVFAEPCGTGQPFIGAPVGGGSEVDHKLWRVLGAGVPAAVGVLPVAVFNQLAMVVYVQSARAIPSSATAGVAELSTVLAGALERLVQADER
jgi:hypothetical protein